MQSQALEKEILIACREYFQERFFPSVWAAEHGPEKFETTSPYCKFDSQTLQLFQSSLYIAGKLAQFSS